MTTSRVIDSPTPVLTVTTRVTPSAVNGAIAHCVAALRETAKQLGVLVVDVPLKVDHGDPGVVEVCLPVHQLPDTEPPRPIAAEVLVPGTRVDTVTSP